MRQELRQQAMTTQRREGETQKELVMRQQQLNHQQECAPNNSSGSGKGITSICKEQAPYAQFSQEEQGVGVGMGTEDRRIRGSEDWRIGG